jgi:cytoskeletal protein CcmA (bactofilin family)
MDLKVMLRKLDERFANGEVTEETYKEIKRRYEAEAHEGHAESMKGKPPCGAKGGRERVPLIRVSGSDDYEGDVFAVKVDVSGSSDVAGDVDAEVVEISGSCDVSGSVKASRSFCASGSCDIGGSIEAPDIHISGACDIGGNLVCETLNVSGASEIAGDVTGGECKLTGAVDIGGTIRAKGLIFTGASDMNRIEAETVEGRGAFEFGKMIAKEVTLRPVDIANAESIEADAIFIKPHTADGRLDVDRLVAKGRLDIDGVVADEASGDEVAVGPRCRIGSVTGRIVEIDPTAKVDKVTRL